MILGKVCGTIHSTINHEFYDGKRLLILDRLNPDGKPTGRYLIAIDAAGAGAGETVLVIDEGNCAREITKSTNAPVRSIIVGIVDEVTMAS
jgi:ethanolamine utilization protein EutN